MKKFFKRVWLVIKYIVAIFVDVVFPVVDLLQAILLILPIPGIKNFVLLTQKYEEVVILWVNKIKEIQDQVEDAAEKAEDKPLPKIPKNGDNSFTKVE